MCEQELLLVMYVTILIRLTGVLLKGMAYFGFRVPHGQLVD